MTLTLRPAVHSDAAVAARLVNEHAVKLGLPPDAGAEQVASFWAGDLVQPLVVESAGAVVGCGELYLRSGGARIDAIGEGRELLLAELERRAAAARPSATVVLHEADPGRELLARRGYRVVRTSYDMEMPLDRLPAAVWPEGVSMRFARPGDERTFYAVQERAFADTWRHHPRPFEEWAHLYLELRAFVPSLWLLAEAGDEPVGVAICEGGLEGDEGTGWIHVLGVVPAWRGRGLGAALLHGALGALAGAGLRRAALSVDADPTGGAVRLYERAGLRVAHRFETWEREL